MRIRSSRTTSLECSPIVDLDASCLVEMLDVVRYRSFTYVRYLTWEVDALIALAHMQACACQTVAQGKTTKFPVFDLRLHSPYLPGKAAPSP